MLLLGRFATVEFTVEAALAREVSQVTGVDIPIVDSAPHMPGLQVLLRPGEGKLFVVRAGHSLIRGGHATAMGDGI